MTVPTLTPGHQGQMLGDAIQHIKSLPQDANQRADAFEALAKQIEQHWGGTWNATRGKGTDGSDIFLGRQGEALVISPDGKLHRGSLGKGIGINASGLEPDYDALKSLD